MRHRKPPRTHWAKGKGFCRWCGEAVKKPDGSPSVGRWHSECVTLYKIAAWPAETRLAVWKRDRGICAECSADLAEAAFREFPERHKSAAELRTFPPYWAPKWQADHIRPLIEANGDLAFWDLANVRILCDACHKLKTKEDVGRLAARRRAAVQPNLL